MLALDLDSVAVRIAAANAAANGVGDRVRTLQGTLDGRQAVSAGYDCIVANISAEATLEMAPALVAALQRGGVAIVSGITAERVEECAKALAAAGASILETAAEGDWRAIVSRLP